MKARRRGKGAWLGIVAVVLGFGAQAGAAHAEESAQLAVYAGAYDISKTRSTEVGVEYRLRPRAWGLVPAVGGAATEDGAFWGYAGLQRPFRIVPGWRLTPGFAVSVYEEGSTGKNLGGAVEFRSSLELARRLVGGSSLGLAVYHLSNGGLYDDNPGSNSVVLTWAFGR